MQKPAKLRLQYLCPTYPIGHQYLKPCLYIPRQRSHNHVAQLFSMSLTGNSSHLPSSSPALLPHSPDRAVHSLTPSKPVPFSEGFYGCISIRIDIQSPCLGNNFPLEREEWKGSRVWEQSWMCASRWICIFRSSGA